MSQDESKSNRTCLTCSGAIDACDLASMQCGHSFHYQCLQVQLSDQIDQEHYPTCCPIKDCMTEPSMYFMSVVLEDIDFKKYLALEKKNIQDFNNYVCSFCTQSFLAFPSSKLHKCLKCYQVICLYCLCAAHPNRPCSSQQNNSKAQLPPIKKYLSSQEGDVTQDVPLPPPVKKIDLTIRQRDHSAKKISNISQRNSSNSKTTSRCSSNNVNNNNNNSFFTGTVAPSTAIVSSRKSSITSATPITQDQRFHHPTAIKPQLQLQMLNNFQSESFQQAKNIKQESFTNSLILMASGKNFGDFHIAKHAPKSIVLCEN